MTTERGPKDLRRAAADFRLRYYGRYGNPGPPPAMAELAPEVMQLVDETIYGEIYNRPAVNLQTRSLCTIAALTVLGNSPELLARHIQGALHVGVTREQISEILSQMVFYGGMPAAVNAFRVAKETFDQNSGYRFGLQSAAANVQPTPEAPAPTQVPVPGAGINQTPRSTSDETRVHRDRQHGQPNGRQPNQGRPPANRPRPPARGGNQPSGDGRGVGRQSKGSGTGQRSGTYFTPRPKGRGGSGPGGKRNTGRRN
ncbi:uncharacterized protein METZ01_LOCUS148682 [marine metagenome]|uniref:Carboxymuconolactone decarboxylase-like domain-containing protein n=1 Tax=marine metagenome TaxID=408172 RepID=A0A382A2R3_9ZZZZ